MIPRADLSHTLDFVKEYLPTPNAKILEVGCGTGCLAAELVKSGYQVTAIDISPEAIEAARRNGVHAEVADIEQFECAEPFDAVLFSRSLHHIHSLDKALVKVKALLNERGRVLAEDFSLEQMDEKTADWFYELRELVALLGNVPGDDTQLDPMARWTAEHKHEPPLHSQKAMLAAMELKFGNVHSSPVPYLFRNFAENFEGFAQGASALQKVFDWEKRQIEKGLIQSIGLRIVAKKRFSYMK